MHGHWSPPNQHNGKNNSRHSVATHRCSKTPVNIQPSQASSCSSHHGDKPPSDTDCLREVPQDYIFVPHRTRDWSWMRLGHQMKEEALEAWQGLGWN